MTKMVLSPLRVQVMAPALLLVMVMVMAAPSGSQALVVMTHDAIGSAAIQAGAGPVQLQASLGGSPFGEATTPGMLLLQGFWFPSQGSSDVEGEPGRIAFALGRNSPNPFRPTTIIPYAVAGQGDAGVATRMEIYDVDGRLVTRLVAADLPSGNYRAEWRGCDASGRPVPAGVYYCRLQSGRRDATRTLVLLR